MAYYTPGVINVPVFFHVITGTGDSGEEVGFVSDQQIKDQIEVLMSAFGEYGISFYLVGIGRVRNNA